MTALDVAVLCDRLVSLDRLVFRPTIRGGLAREGAMVAMVIGERERGVRAVILVNGYGAKSRILRRHPGLDPAAVTFNGEHPKGER